METAECTPHPRHVSVPVEDQDVQPPRGLTQTATPAEVRLEEAVRRVQRDGSLPLAEKSKRIHELVCAKRVRVPEPASRYPQDSSNKTWRDSGKKVLGCRHYARKCRMRAECCGRYVSCRLCHDEQFGTSHLLDRKKTKRVWCMVCGAKDVPAEQNCKNCGVQFASYYCDVCKFWDGEVSPRGKSVYHCDKCGCCRVGKGLGIDALHCDKCGICLEKKKFSKHRCIERSCESNCPICTESLAESREAVSFFRRCGHAMHSRCLLNHWESRYTCPICMQSIVDMSPTFRLLDKRVRDDRKNMTNEYRNKVSRIFCQDCQHKSETSYHFLYHRCGKCGSYNTRIMEVYQRRSEPPGSKHSRAESSDVRNSVGTWESDH